MNMLKAVIAKSTDDPRFQQLYYTSFADFEKIPLKNIERTFGNGGTLRLFYDGDRFVGLCYTYNDGGEVFLVYLATEARLRGLGYGSEILEYMANETEYDHMFLVLEKEEGTPAERRIRHRRKEFYRRNGWKDTGVELLSDGYYFDSMYLDDPIPEEMMIHTIKRYEETHSGVRY